MGKYRTYDAELKARVVLEALQGQKTAAQICRENDIADDLLARWKREFLERAPELFRTPPRTLGGRGSHRRVGAAGGPIDAGTDCGKKSLQSAELTVEQQRQIVNQHAGEFSRELLCAVVELASSTLYYHAQPADDLDLLSALEAGGAGISTLRLPAHDRRTATARMAGEPQTRAAPARSA